MVDDLKKKNNEKKTQKKDFKHENKTSTKLNCCCVSENISQ